MLGADALVEWQPILLGGLFRLTGRSSWARSDARRRRLGMAEIELRAARYGLPSVCWPDPWPGDYLFAMRAVTYAQAVGRGEAMALTALRAAFTEGVNLSDPDGVLRVAERSGLDPAAVAAGTADPEIKRALRTATDAAHAAGVFGVPTLLVGGEVFWGEDRLDAAAAALARVA